MPRKDRKPPNPDHEPVMRRRDASSVSLLAHRVREVAYALAAEDEDAARGELRALSLEAGLLAARVPLLPSRLESRQRVASRR